VASSWFCQFSK